MLTVLVHASDRTSRSPPFPPSQKRSPPPSLYYTYPTTAPHQAKPKALKMFRLVASRSKSIRPIASCVDSFAARAFSRQSSAVAASSQYQIPTSAFPSHQRQFSSSHDDFSPQKKHNLDGNENESEMLKMIDSHVKANNIMLYMKGSPSQPMVSQVVPINSM